MRKQTYYTIVVFTVVFAVIPQWSLSSPLTRTLRSPSTTAESHISNFLHQHRSDSRADKPELKPLNSSDPFRRRPSKSKSTTTEAPVSQTELLVNLIHNTIQTVRDQFPALVSAISSPKDPPTTTKHPRRALHPNHITHAHSMQERSTNKISAEAESNEDSEESSESGEGSGFDGEDFDEALNSTSTIPSEEPTQDINPIGFIPPALIRTIVEASGSSAARGSAGASAGSAASASAGVASSSSSGSGRNARQTENSNQDVGGGSADFIGSLVRNKLRALATLFVSPVFSASSFAQRSLGGVLSSSSGISPEPQPSHQHSNDHRHGHHNHHHSDEHHHHDHDHRSGDHHAEGHEHHSHHHSGEHSHHSHGHHEPNSTVDDSTNIIPGNDDSQDNARKFYYRDAPFNTTSENSTNNSTTDDLPLKEAPKDDGPLRIVLFQGGLADEEIAENQKKIVRKTREAKALLTEGFGIYILEIFGSIAGLTWGALHQITHLFHRRSDDPDDFY